MKRIVSASLIAVTAVAVTCTSVLSPASAATTIPYSIRTAAVGTDGYAVASGTITFVARDRFRVSSTVTDKCGAGRGDGEGAYLWIAIEYMNGAIDRRLSLNWDIDGCNNGNRGTRSTTFDFNVGIKRVRIRLDEADGPSDASESAYTTWKDNPYT